MKKWITNEGGRKCTKCLEFKSWDFFSKGSGPFGYNTRCCKCLSIKRKSIDNTTLRSYCNKYEKTVNGFLMRVYRNMKSRITGVQVAKFHLYKGKTLLPKEDFYKFGKDSLIFQKLFKEYEASNWNRKLAPSVDRIDSSKGYKLDNMEWITHSENSYRGCISRYNKGK